MHCDSLEIDIPILKKRRYICLQRMFTSSVKTTTFGDCWQKNVISVYGVGRSVFGTFSYFACQKMGLGISRSKNEDHFLLPTLLTYGGFDTCLMWILNSGHYRATLWQMDNIFHFQILISRIRAPGSDLLSIEYFLTPDRLPLFNFQI